MITIELKDLEFYAYHGVYEEEREKGNTFIVNLAISAELQEAIQDDKLTDTIDYETLYAIVKNEMELPSNLLEHVAGRIRSAIIKDFTQIKSLEISIEKLSPPIGGNLKSSRITLAEDY